MEFFAAVISLSRQVVVAQHLPRKGPRADPPADTAMALLLQGQEAWFDNRGKS